MKLGVQTAGGPFTLSASFGALAINFLEVSCFTLRRSYHGKVPVNIRVFHRFAIFLSISFLGDKGVVEVLFRFCIISEF